MKKLLSIVMVITTVFVFAACQVTPEAPIVVQKDTERMVEQARTQDGAASLKELGIPDGRYTFDTTGANGKLRIHVDTDIVTPNVTAMPIVKVSMGLFSQEQVTGIFNYLFPDQKPTYDFGQVETKADIQQEILLLKKQHADGDYEGSEEEFNEEIAHMEEAYHIAPDAAPEGGISDGTLTRFDLESSDSTSRALSVSNEEHALYIFTHTAIEGINGMQLPNLSYYSKASDRVYTTRNITRTDGTNLPEAAANSLTIPYDEAQALCVGFFEAAGFSRNDFCMADSFVLDDTGADELPGSNYAYRCIYTRMVENIPLFLDRTGQLHNQDEAFALPWSYEYIGFTIDNKGIVSVQWRMPVNIGNIVENASALKPFDEIMDVFEGMMKTSYEGIVLTTFDGEVEFDINVDSTELCLLRIREQGGAQTDGLLIPAWVFSGHNKATDKNGEVKYLQGASALASFDPMQDVAEGGGALSKFDMAPGVLEDDTIALLAINAIDGSIIDLSKGY